MARALDTAPDSIFETGSIATVAGDLGTWLLRAVVERQKTAYDTALDLLAADAFVTYAFEAASGEGTDVTGMADQLLTRVRA